MIARGTIAMLALGLMAPAMADDADAFLTAMTEAVTGVTLARAYVEACDAHDPDGQQQRRDALASWAHRVDLAGYDRVMAGAVEALPALTADVEQHTQTVRGAMPDEVTKDQTVCDDLARALEEDRFDLSGPISILLRDAEDFGIKVAEAPPPPPSSDVAVLPLAYLSAQALVVMDDIGSKAGAESDPDLREAREEHLLEWLRQRGMLVVHGRVTAEDELREWRDDQQSRFMTDCLSFEPTYEELMAQSLGQDMVVVGEPRWVNETQTGGIIGLRDCSVFDLADTGQALESGEDSAGLMLRPPEFDEAYAGPNAGIAMGDVDRVLYAAEFTNRMDGFGNGYTDRQEDIYVLLRDGTAYRHAWPFAFTDLDVDLSRQREPDRWFTWSDSWGRVSVTQSGGPDEGEEIDLSEAQRLVPLPSGQPLDQTYYFLNVGMGGARSDREYVFSPDGSVTHTRGGFVAGNFGTSYIIVSPGEDVSQSSYRFEEFTLVIDGPEGEERHFAAMIDGDDAARPEELLIDGQVYWTRDEE